MSVSLTPGVTQTHGTASTGEVLPKDPLPRKGGTDTLPPPGSNEPGTIGDAPSLLPPSSMDASEIMNRFLALKMKMDGEGVKAELEDIKARGDRQRTENEEIARKIEEAAKKLEESKAGSLAMKIFGWIAVALTVVAAVLTGGALAIAAAAVAVTMAALSEAGVMEKMTEAIAESLMKNGMGEDEAKKAAMWISMGIQLAVAAATLAAGFASTASTAVRAANDATRLAIQMSQKAMTLGNIARGAGAVATAGQGAAGIASSVAAHDAAQIQADQAEIQKFLARLKQMQEDDAARVQEMVQSMNDSMSRMMAIMNRQSESVSTTIQHMG